jgi:hypothetical protein
MENKEEIDNMDQVKEKTLLELHEEEYHENEELYRRTRFVCIIINNITAIFMVFQIVGAFFQAVDRIGTGKVSSTVNLFGIEDNVWTMFSIAFVICLATKLVSLVLSSYKMSWESDF